MSGHERGSKIAGFCSLPANPKCSGPYPCPSPKANYIEACRPSWHDYHFWRLINAETGQYATKKVFEAHHIVTVAKVEQIIMAHAPIAQIVQQTKWCINEEINMIALPLWGHTVKWYCSEGNTEPPPFADLPQHDWDHYSYSKEVEEELISIRNEVEAAAQSEPHPDVTATLKGTLDDLSGKFRGYLKSRGAGTHEAWNDCTAASDSGQSAGCNARAFSMAKELCDEKAFPKFTRRKLAMIARFLKLATGGA